MMKPNAAIGAISGTMPNEWFRAEQPQCKISIYTRFQNAVVTLKRHPSVTRAATLSAGQLSGGVGGIGGSSCNCAHAKHNVAAKYKNPSRAAAAGAL
jgi:hypothetical protein